MKSINIKIVTFFTIMLIGVASIANNGTRLTVDQRATLRMQKINSVCVLTTQQQAQVKQLYVNAINDRKASEVTKKGSKVKGTGNKVPLKATQKAEKQQNRVDLKTVLTPDQLSKLKASRQSK